MRSCKIVAAVFSFLMLMAVGLPNAKADAYDWDTYLTFSAPVELPGLVLAPGKYEFRILDRTGSGYLVGVLNARGDYMEVVQAEADYRTNTTDQTVVNLEKRHPGWPEAIKSWFYPDENYGVEFVYPKRADTVRPDTHATR
ncbi:MAG TPA: hypothetical protein VE398_18245 [Acidobacteriota bacterium]|nr:hypothetical protein [Acidobacteriota bacterium]